MLTGTKYNSNQIACGKQIVRKSAQSNNMSIINRYRRIVKGVNSYYGEWPWIASLKNPVLKRLIEKHAPTYMNWSLVGSDSHICGGTLINSEWIVTAQHCLYYNFTPQAVALTSNWSATLGAYDISGNSEHSVSIKIDKVVFQENWLGMDLDDNDFAMMHLSQPVNFTDYIYPACLPKSPLATPGNICYAVGWGTSFSLNDTLVNPILKHATLLIMEKKESKACITQTNKEICTSPVSGSVCRGDSGGPLLCQGSNKEWIFVGITVRGSGCQKQTDRSIFTSVYHYLDFLYKYMNSNFSNNNCINYYLEYLSIVFATFLVFLL